MSKDKSPKAAFVAVIGRPSVGKSTLVNGICGEKVSIVSAVPQTTRNAIRGIVNREQGQLVFIDTPGRYKSAKKTNKKLLDISAGAIEDADLILYVLDASRAAGAEDEETAALLAPHAHRAVAAINKIDMVENAACDPALEFLSRSLPALPSVRIFPVSAKKNEGIDALLAALYDLAPEGEPFYGADYYTDQEVDFRIAEIIREQAINRLRQELPHALRVEIADAQFTETAPSAQEGAPDGNAPDVPEGKLWVRAFIVVERESQKGIVVGKGGAMIKAIRLAALKELRKIFDWQIELDLRVK
ncbi:MAG: GTPase Era [Treponema sp.]|nr:GTPase Era [Treponema sp.]